MVEILIIYPGEIRFRLFVIAKLWEQFCESMVDGSVMPSFLMCQDEEHRSIFVDVSKALAFYVVGKHPKRKRAKNNKTARTAGDGVDS